MKVKQGGGTMEEAGKFYHCDWLLDVSQCISRKNHCNHFRAMCSGSAYFAFDLDRMITPMEHLLVLGWPRRTLASRIKDLSPGCVRDLAGESMSPACIGAVMTALCLSVEHHWKKATP